MSHDALVPTVEVVPASETDRAVLRMLLQLHLHDLSEVCGDDVDRHGEFAYPYLDHYWTETSSRQPFLLRVAGRWAGFALVRTGHPHEMAEFFVLRKYRRAGIGTEAARQIFARLPGEWRVTMLPGHHQAVRFWRKAIPFPFQETTDDGGKTQRFVAVAPSRDPAEESSDNAGLSF